MEDRLRNRILDEIAAVKHRVDVATDPATDPVVAKDHMRLAHADQRVRLLAEASDFIVRREDQVIAEFANGDEIDPASIDPEIVMVESESDADLFRFASLRWSVPVSAGYGRRTRFLLRDRQNGKLIGIFALGDPVIGLAPRDHAIGWATPERHKNLYHVYDGFVLGGVEPYRQLLGGKLVALTVLSTDVAAYLIDKYEGNVTKISRETKDPTPVLFTTTSSLGRSSVYNRLTLDGERVWHPVGYTKGFGHFQFSDKVFEELRDFVEQKATETGDEKLHQSAKYGKGANWKFREIGRASCRERV